MIIRELIACTIKSHWFSFAELYFKRRELGPTIQTILGKYLYA